jgi:hypothetical protein
MRPCSTRGSTSAPSGRCTASWRPTTRCGSGGTSSGIPATPPPSSSPAGQPVRGRLDGGASGEPYPRRAVHPRNVRRQGIGREQLTIRADRGPAMTSKPVALLLADLGVTKTHARPHVSNDNLYSEAQFKTLKYRPAFPDRFGSIQDARDYCHDFFPWSTPRTGTAASACSRPPTYTTAPPTNGSQPGRASWPRPTPRTRNASPAGSPSRRRFPRKSGSMPPRPAPPTSRLCGGRDPRYAEAPPIPSRRGEYDGFTARSHGHSDLRPPGCAARG